jgi:two-component system, OmpR family, alkaline phosphatase synthesis response regulator PhoP
MDAAIPRTVRASLLMSETRVPLDDGCEQRAFMERILIIEDDRAVQRALKRLFEPEGYTVISAYDGRSALAGFQASSPSVVILDLRLPGITGTDLCCTIKRNAPSLPLLVLSAAADVADKVKLLELGADDYVTKPFSPRELLARIQAALRRSAMKTSSAVLAFDDVSVDFTRMELTRAGRTVACTRQEFKVLRFLASNAERVISRDELLNAAWGYQAYAATRTVDNHIMRLRRKTEKKPTSPVHLRTVHGVGYKFVP